MSFVVKDLEVKVGEKKILKKVEMIINRGELVCLLGPNGSGKSSLMQSLMGNPIYQVNPEAKIKIDGVNVSSKSVDERVNNGLFLVFQSPVVIPGVTIREVILAWQREKKRLGDKFLGSKDDVWVWKKTIEEKAKRMGINKELLKRGLNEDFSGGEKKRMELLQLTLYEPRYVLIDEIDSGLDIDGIVVAAKEIDRLVKKEKVGVMLVSHSQSLWRYLKPDRVLVMKEGSLVKEGGAELINELQDKGYEQL